jgi:hypothetical protein
MHATQPFATFESRETSTRLAPVMNLRAIQAGDDTHDKLATANTVRWRGFPQDSRVVDGCAQIVPTRACVRRLQATRS